MVLLPPMFITIHLPPTRHPISPSVSLSEVFRKFTSYVTCDYHSYLMTWVFLAVTEIVMHETHIHHNWAKWEILNCFKEQLAGRFFRNVGFLGLKIYKQFRAPTCITPTPILPSIPKSHFRESLTFKIQIVNPTTEQTERSKVKYAQTSNATNRLQTATTCNCLIKETDILKERPPKQIPMIFNNFFLLWGVLSSL